MITTKETLRQKMIDFCKKKNVKDPKVFDALCDFVDFIENQEARERI